MNQNRPTGTVTFLFTDIADSTRLWDLYPEAMKAALAKHDSILQEAIAANHGSIVKTTGDGVHAVFTTALDGINAAAAMQRGLLQASEALQIRVRMGLHTAEATTPGEAGDRLLELRREPDVGVILIEDTLYDRLPEEVRREFGRHPLPMIVPFPGPLWQVRPESAEAYIVELLRQVVGYRVRLR